MSKQLITLAVDDDLAMAKLIFDRNKVHHILILDDKEELAGIITDRDLFKHLSPAIGTAKATTKESAQLNKKLHSIMSRNVVYAREDITLNDAVLLFYDNNISCLPIIDDNLVPVGIITWRDIIKILAIQHRHKQKQTK